jgi:Uma2 family endonuclease
MATLTKRPSRALPLPAGTARIRNGTVRLSRPKYDGLKMSLQDFLDWEREPDGWKYEWNNGVIEINEVNMTLKEQYIIKNISRAFLRTVAHQQGGEMLAEVDCAISDTQIRRPDVAYYTAEQIQMGREQAPITPAFVIEIISQHDKDLKLQSKLDEYFAAGALCVWYIRPYSMRVSIYSSPVEVHICQGDDVCSAVPALDFSMKAHEIFA